MEAFNFLSMEKFASCNEAFTNPIKKETFTSDEIEKLMNVDNDINDENNEIINDVNNDENNEIINDENNARNEKLPTLDKETILDELSDKPELDTTDDTNEIISEETELDNITEGFNGSRYLEYEQLKKYLLIIVCILTLYLLIKFTKYYYNKKMNVIYTQLKFLKIKNINLDIDLVLSIILGLIIYFILSRINIF
jgi:hypothetical protein